MVLWNRCWLPVWLIGLCAACSKAHPDSGERGGSASDSGNDVVDDTGVLDSDHGIQTAFFVVHLEPGSPVDPVVGGINHSRAETYLEQLVELTALADTHQHHLTLMWSPQWASYLMSSECDSRLLTDKTGALAYGSTSHSRCIDLIREMEGTGHEMALHHHPLEAASGWDGFTDESQWTADRDDDGVDEVYFSDGGGLNGPDPFYLGTLVDMMDLLDALPMGGENQILSATTEEFPDSVRYSAAGGYLAYEGPDEPGHLVSRPCATSYNGHGVWQLNMRLFTTDTGQRAVLNTELPAAVSDFAVTKEGAYSMGFVTHAKNVDETGSTSYEQLFTELNDLNLSLQTLSEVMESDVRTATDPLSAEDSSECAEASI